MNNEENKPLEEEGVAERESFDSSNEATVVKSGNWWKNLSTGIKSALIAGVACVVAAVVLLVILLGGNNNNSGNGGNGGNGGNSGNGGNNPGQSNTVTYKINIVTNGGMGLAKLPVYICKYEDGAAGDIVNYVATNEEGVAVVELPAGGTYAAQINFGLPEGYEAASYYPLVSNDFTITVKSAILPDTGLSGVSYSAGDVIRDFTVTTTYLEKNDQGEYEVKQRRVTLSDLLKEKKAVLINFWYTECSWCITEFPLMQQAYEKFQDDIAIIALDPPDINNDTAIDVKNFQLNSGLTFDVGLDVEGFYSAFGVEGYPTSVMIDRYGVITMIHPGAITSQRVFDVVFDYFTADDYKQQIVYDFNQIVPKEKPDVEMPSSEEISSVFDKGSIPGIEYLPYPDSSSDEEKEYSWPFVIDKITFDGGETEYEVIKTSNAFKEGSYAQMVFNVPLKSGEVVAFDYLSSTERGADILYVIVDGKDIYSISGQGNEWKTCFAYVAEEDATYEIAFVYMKDSSDDVGEDTVYLKDLRVVSESDIDSDTYIYRFAVTKPDEYGSYGEYVDIYLGNDGYYHVGSADGPILLADLMGYTRFSSENSAYFIAVELIEKQSITQSQYANIIEYCNYASNSNIYGVVPVTEELREMLVLLSQHRGDATNENDWMRLCCYYDAYGTDGKQLEDPIKGLALFSAYDVILSEKGDKDFPNSLTYNRVIMPRGLLAKFTPSVSGTYLITSYAPDPNKEGYGLETDAWIFVSDGNGGREEWFTYENVDRQNTGDLNNCYMILYLEAGKDYYIDIAYYDVYQEGTINFRIEQLGGEGSFRFSLASPGPFTALESVTGELTETIIEGIPVVLGSDGYWREDREDGRLGSIIYADFTQFTTIFQNNVIFSDVSGRIDMITAGAFNFTLTEEDLYVLNYLEKVGGDVERCKRELREQLGESYNAKYTDYDYNGDPYTVTGFAVEEVLAGIYHGAGADETNAMREYTEKIIKARDTITIVNEDGTGTIDYVVEEGDPRIGCVAVDARLAEILQLLMDKYTFEGVENSWLKLCYYEQYFCAATPK